MANVSVLYDKVSDRGAFSGGSWLASMPLGLLTTQDPMQMARTAGLTAAQTQFRVDMGVSPLRAINQFVLLRHNVTLAGSVRYVLSNSATDAAAQRVYDSGEIRAWDVTVGWGSRPWGAFPWNGIDPSLYPSGTVSIHTIKGGKTYQARYLFVYINDPTNPAGYVQAGRFMAGTAWQPSINMDVNPGIRWVDPSAARRTRGGLKLVRKAAKYRTVSLTLSWLDKSEAIGFAMEFDRVLGKSEEFFLMMDPTEESSFRVQRSIYASKVDTSDVTEGDFDRFSWRLEAEEII